MFVDECWDEKGDTGPSGEARGGFGHSLKFDAERKFIFLFSQCKFVDLNWRR